MVEIILLYKMCICLYLVGSGYRNQITIWNNTVRTFIDEWVDGCQVYLRVHRRVDRVIIFWYGETTPFCFAENKGKNVYPGEQLKRRQNPFTFQKQITRLRDMRRRRKFLYWTKHLFINCINMKFYRCAFST